MNHVKVIDHVVLADIKLLNLFLKTNTIDSIITPSPHLALSLSLSHR